MKNLCKWGVVAIGARTASGYDELIAAFTTKDEARAWLMMRVPTARHRHPWKIEQLVFDEPEPVLDNPANTPDNAVDPADSVPQYRP